MRVRDVPQRTAQSNELRELSGGNAPIYYAHNLFKFISSEKYNSEEHGFDGFLVRCELLKSRTNKAGQSCQLVYNQMSGFDPVLTLLQYAQENNLVDGRNPYRYFKDFKDIKFDSRKFKEEFLNNEQLRMALMESTVPILQGQLSRSEKDGTKDIDYMELIKRLDKSQEEEFAG